MAIDIGLTGLAMPVAELPGLAREAEARGYRTAWVGEAAGLAAIALSTLILTHTRTLKVANGVIPVQIRTPIVYGQAAATLAHLSPGRFALGLGLSIDIIVGQWHGLPFAPSVQQMREAVQIIRMTAAGERVLAAMTPRPETNLLICHGVLAPRSRWRARVVVYGRVVPEPTALAPPLAAGPDGTGVKSSPRTWNWAALMHRAFGIDVLTCAHCGGRLRLIATLHDPAVIRKILAHLALSHSGQSPGPAPPASGAAAP